MFTGIIEDLGKVVAIEKEGSNVHLTLESSFTNELKIDQSVAHNGICLTVVAIDGNRYTVTAIKETMDKSNLAHWQVNDEVNLERCMKLGARLDGHIVQGHVDGVGRCKAIHKEDGSTIFTFEYESNSVTVEKGSITVNGVSLTVVNSKPNEFSVAIIPFTIEHTMFKHLKVGDPINLEFDIVGKYVSRLMEVRN